MDEIEEHIAQKRLTTFCLRRNKLMSQKHCLTDLVEGFSTGQEWRVAVCEDGASSCTVYSEPV